MKEKLVYNISTNISSNSAANLNKLLSLRVCQQHSSRQSIKYLRLLIARKKQWQFYRLRVSYLPVINCLALLENVRRFSRRHSSLISPSRRTSNMSANYSDMQFIQQHQTFNSLIPRSFQLKNMHNNVRLHIVRWQYYNQMSTIEITNAWLH